MRAALAPMRQRRSTWSSARARWRAAVPGGVLAVLHPAAAYTCPVCFSAAKEGVLETYLLSAAFMTLLPLLIMGAFAAWLRRRLKSASGSDGRQSTAHSFQA